MNCPECGETLIEDALSGEVRPCSTCGSTGRKSTPFQIAANATVGGDNKRRRFEAGVLIVMLVVGLGYYFISTRSSSETLSVDPQLKDLAGRVEADGFTFLGESSVFNRQVLSYARPASLLRTLVHLVSKSRSDTIETIIAVVGMPKGAAYPSNEVVEPAVQEAFDEVVTLGEELRPDSSQALALASENLSPVNDVQTPYLKGIALMDAGWRVTYIVYREYEQGDAAIALMVFVYQRDAEDSESDLREFNAALYGAVDSGSDVLASLEEPELGASIK